jgi:hypothetical protein
VQFLFAFVLKHCLRVAASAKQGRTGSYFLS